MLNGADARLFAGLQAASKKYLFGFQFGKIEGSAEMAGSGARMIQLRFKFTQHSIEQVIRIQFLPFPDRIKRVETGLRAMNFRESHGAIERDDR